MKPFDLLEPDSAAEAALALRNGNGNGGSSARLLAGGSDLLGELKEGTWHYPQLVSLGRIAALRTVEAVDGGLLLGAGLTLGEVEYEPRLQGPWRLLAEAARGIATPEIRNQGTLGGNLCQRPRCLHYRSAALPCLKKGGSHCPAQDSAHQHYLAVFEGGPCHAAHPSDLAPVLLALGATLQIAGPDTTRELPLADFFAAPQDYAHRGHTLAPDELITAVRLPLLHSEWRGTSLKGRERTAGDFSLVSATFGCRLDAGKMRDVRLVLGGVAAAPRDCPQSAALLEGQAPTEALARDAAQRAFANAAPLAHNQYKLPWGRSLVERVIGTVTESLRKP